MKKVIIGLSLLVSLSAMLTSCAKKGCTDSAALNYDSSAKEDDNSCSYASEAFVGSYFMNDTLHADGGPYYSTKTIVISQNTASRGKINIQLGSGITLVADVSGNTFTIANQSIGATPYYGSGYLNGTTLRLVYYYSVGGSLMQHVESTGQRQ